MCYVTVCAHEESVRISSYKDHALMVFPNFVTVPIQCLIFLGLSLLVTTKSEEACEEGSESEWEMYPHFQVAQGQLHKSIA